MLPLPILATTDLGAQVAAAEGVDSNVFQTIAPDGSVLRHPSLFTAVEGAVSVRTSGRSDTLDLRALGRLQIDAPNPDSFSRQDGLLGLTALSTHTLGPRTHLALGTLGTVGSVQASRATDGAAVAFDPFTTRRTAWTASEYASLTRDLDPTLVFIPQVGVTLGGTVVENDPTVGRIGMPLEYLRLTTGADLARRLDLRTRLQASLRLERSRSFYVLDRSGPTPRNVGPIDSAAATATVGFSHRASVPLTATADAGVTLAEPILRGPLLVLPAVTAGLTYAEQAWSLRATAGFVYGSTDPTFGPGGTASGGVFFIGSPAGVQSDLSVLAAAGVARTLLLGGPNDGGDLTTVSASIALRWNIARWVGATAGWDVQKTTFDAAPGATTTTPTASFVRHLVFVGVSGAWSTEAKSTATIATLAARP